VLPAAWSEIEALAYLATDNESGRTSDPDEQQLAALVAQVQAEDAELAALAAGSDERLRELLASLETDEAKEDPGAQLDKAEELRGKWQTEPGQLWQLGAHRLICGDCTDKATVDRVMGGEKAALVFTDPPYGVDYDGGLNERKREKLSGDTSGALYGACMSATVPFCDDSAAWYLWFAGTVGKPVYDAVEAAGYTVRAMIVWNKLDAHYGNFMAQYMQKHEPCLYCVKKPPAWHGPTNEVTVWDVKQPTKNEHHPTEKPVELAERAITNSSDAGAIVADWFSGSGTTLIACEKLGRKCRAVELEPKYVAVALGRWSTMTGQTPVLLAQADEHPMQTESPDARSGA
jgi:DNA modification methylase